LYRTYIGEPDCEIDVYLGFTLFFGGIGLGVAAFLMGSVGQLTGAGGPSEAFVYREAAIAAGMVALPATLSSVVILLPVSKRAVFGAVGGSAVSLVGVFLFVWAYPYSWAVGSGETYAVQVLLVYGVGLAAVLAATGGALVAYHISRVRPGPGDIEGLEEETETESFSDEEIEEDIEQAMENVDLTWGGVERHEGNDLKLRTPEAGEMDLSGMDVEVERVHSGGVDDQVAGLQTVKAASARPRARPRRSTTRPTSSNSCANRNARRKPPPTRRRFSNGRWTASPACWAGPDRPAGRDGRQSTRSTLITLYSP
jgi:hypothetical protein